MPRLKTVARVALSLGMMTAGVLHFLQPEGFVSIVPAWLPAPRALVYISGFFEIAGGLGLFLARTRRAAAWGLVVLYVAVFPANVNMALHHLPLGGAVLPDAALWARLPLQALLIAWAYWLTRPDAGSRGR